MKTVQTIFTVIVLGVLAGCNGAVEQKELLTVDFHEGQTLRYKFVSRRDIVVTWDTTKTGSKLGSKKPSKSSESTEMVVSYTPVDIDPYGVTTIRATCESVKIKRSPSKRRRGAIRTDAAESFAGRTFALAINPVGKIEDYSQLNQLIEEIGRKAFRPSRRKTRIKEPDMISDFIATQWFLWDSVSSIDNPVEGLDVGESWESKLSVPVPMVLRRARDVTYTLDEIRDSENGRLAVIRSSYRLAESVPRSWPIPYSGRFQMSGKFGFLKGYKVLDLQGEGEELFNIDAGRTEQYNQRYKMQLQASLPLGIKVNPEMTIKQSLTMQLLE